MDSFFNDSFSEDIWRTKYAGKFETPLEYYTHLADMVSLGNKETAKKFFNIMWNKRFSPGGRILAFAGRPDSNMSLVNCTTHSIEEDSLESINEAAYSLMRASSRGQGIGLDISKLRPKESPVNNAARTSTGAISFMEMLNAVGGTIGQEGRRAALLFSISDSHPDLYRPDDKSIQCQRCGGKGCKNCVNGFIPYDFIHVKRIPGKVENANISVKISDALMRAVQVDHMWELGHSGRSGNKVFDVSRLVPAQELFGAIARSAHTSAEPGVLYWDTARRLSNSDRFGEEWGVVGLNACVVGDTLISTEVGLMTIEELSKMENPPRILTLNESTGEFEYDEVAWVRMTRENADVITLELEDGKELTLTPDHRVLTERGWVEASQLGIEDVVIEIA